MGWRSCRQRRPRKPWRSPGDHLDGARGLCKYLTHLVAGSRKSSNTHTYSAGPVQGCVLRALSLE